MGKLSILDTTLRDGDQAAGFSFSVQEKLSLAESLAACQVDIIEAGFPASSPSDAKACSLIASRFAFLPSAPTIAFMCRSREEEILRCIKLFGPNDRGLLHLSLPVSDNHMQTKLGLDRKAIIKRAVDSVKYASSLIGHIEMGAEDATRADLPFLAEYCDAVTSHGAHSVNIADTLGIALPDEFSRTIAYLIKMVPAFRDGKAILGVHCHNDLGLATANTLAGIKAGCKRVEVSVMGIGERAGNAPLEELSAILERQNNPSRLNFEGIAEVVQKVSSYCGTSFSPMKSVVGSNTQAHASGIHQQGLFSNLDTYHNPSAVGKVAVPQRIVLSRHSGRHGVIASAIAYANLTLTDAQASELLSMIKVVVGEEGGTFGISEFLFLLQDLGLIKHSLYRCASYDSRSDGVFHSLEASISRCLSDGNEILSERMYGYGKSLDEAALLLVQSLRAEPFTIKNYSISGFGGQHGTRYRLFLSAFPSSKPDFLVSCERIGKAPVQLFIQGLLDVINVLLLKS